MKRARSFHLLAAALLATAPGGAAGQKQSPPIAFDVKVLVDKTCAFCEPTLVDVIKRQHAGAQVSMIDANSEEGRAFIERYDVQVLPFYFLDQKVSQDPNFQYMKGHYVKTNDGYSIQPGPDFYTPAIQLRRPRVPHRLDLFVESTAPSAAQVEAQIVKFLTGTDLQDLTFSIHYIVQETDVPASELAGPLTSRRGEKELRESMRQACLFQHAPIRTFFTYLACKDQNILDDSRGDACLQLTDPIKQCLGGLESESLLRQDARLVRELGITGGPVLVWENRYGPFGWNEVDWNTVLGQNKEN